MPTIDELSLLENKAKDNHLLTDILVAGRDFSQMQFIKRILTRRRICGFNEISLMCNGLQVREALQVNTYKLVILNEDIGGMNWLNCIEILRFQHIDHHILLMVYNPRVEMVREAFLLGVRGVYEVPILIDSFSAMVCNLLNRKRIDCGTEIYDLYTKHRFNEP